MSARGILLDRDGTLIDVVRDEETGVITTAFHPSHIRLLSGVVAGLRRLRDAGFVFGIATNQPGPAKGQCSAASVERTNAALVEELAGRGITIGAVKSCMHHPSGGAGGDASLVGPCRCRKPQAGLLDDLVAELGLDRGATWMIGDTSSDIEAGRAAGMRTALLLAPNRCELCPIRPRDGFVPVMRATPDVHAGSLDAIAAAILGPSTAITE